MKTLVLLGLITVAVVMLGGSSGCAPPGYSTQERFQQIGRNWDYEWSTINDDIDEFWLLRPATDLTYWNVQ
jgi:hypothetical protein